MRRAIEKALKERSGAPDPLEALSALAAPTADIKDMLAEIDAGRS